MSDRIAGSRIRVESNVQTQRIPALAQIRLHSGCPRRPWTFIQLKRSRTKGLQRHLLYNLLRVSRFLSRYHLGWMLPTLPLRRVQSMAPTVSRPVVRNVVEKLTTSLQVLVWRPIDYSIMTHWPLLFEAYHTCSLESPFNDTVPSGLFSYPHGNMYHDANSTWGESIEGGNDGGPR